MSSSQPITKEKFGITSDGEEVYKFTLTAGEITVRVLNFGCVVKDILVPDRVGKVTDICLGYDTFDGYETNPAFLGAICDRVANRIDGATFELDSVQYSVSKNDPLGNNMCHGGFVGLTRRYFDYLVEGAKLILTYVDKDGSEGFPGDLNVKVTYELTEEDGLMMDYEATTNKPTPVDLSNHFMVNLAGHANGFIGEHMVCMNTTQILEFNEKFIPTGKVKSVVDSALDFRRPQKVSDILQKIPNEDGLHHAHVLPGKRGERKLVARAEDPESGRYLEVSSTEPVFISYSCYYMDFLLKGSRCKDGAVYQKTGGILFMPQGYPNAVNIPTFPSCVLRPGDKYHTTTWYMFGATS